MRPAGALVQRTIGLCHGVTIWAQQFEIFRGIVKAVPIGMIHLDDAIACFAIYPGKSTVFTLVTTSFY